MAFFNNENFLTPCTIPAVEGAQYDPDNGGAANIAMEAYEDQLNVVKAIHAADMAELACKHQCKGMTESYVAEQIEAVQEKSIKDIFETIKDALKKFFGKIVTFFKKLYEKFFVYTKSNKSFAEKYKYVIENIEISGLNVKVQGYKYENIKTIAAYIERGVDGVEKELKVLGDSMSDNLSKLAKDDDPKRGNYAQEDLRLSMLKNHFGMASLTDSDLSNSSLSSLLIKKLRGSDDAKGEITYTQSELAAEIETLRGIDVATIKKIEAKMTKEFNKILSNIDKAEKTYVALPADNSKKSNAVEITRNYHKSVVALKSTCLTAVSAYKTVATEYSNQIKSATMSMITAYKEAKKAANKKK